MNDSRLPVQKDQTPAMTEEERKSAYAWLDGLVKTHTEQALAKCIGVYPHNFRPIVHREKSLTVAIIVRLARELESSVDEVLGWDRGVYLRHIKGYERSEHFLRELRPDQGTAKEWRQVGDVRLPPTIEKWNEVEPIWLNKFSALVMELYKNSK